MQPWPERPARDCFFQVYGDGSIDISVHLDTAAVKAELPHHAPWVLGLEGLITADSERILRVRLRNPRK